MQCSQEDSAEASCLPKYGHTCLCGLPCLLLAALAAILFAVVAQFCVLPSPWHACLPSLESTFVQIVAHVEQSANTCTELSMSVALNAMCWLLPMFIGATDSIIDTNSNEVQPC